MQRGLGPELLELILGIRVVQGVLALSKTFSEQTRLLLLILLILAASELFRGVA